MTGHKMLTILVSVAALTGCTYQLDEQQRVRADTILAKAQELPTDSFMAKVLGRLQADDFDHSANPALSTDNGVQVLDNLRIHPVTEVVCRRAANPFNKSTNAWEGDGTPRLRCSRLEKREDEEWVGTILHEQAHAARYLHNGNSREGNQCTVPHLIGDLAAYTLYRRTGVASLPKDACDSLRRAIE